MHSNVHGYFQRIKAGISPQAVSIAHYIEDKTYINLKKFSFAGHEYQRYFIELIEKDPDIDISAEKCSQIGLSEICFRAALAMMDLTPGFSVGYGMPSAKFSQEVLKTRISPIIEQSPTLKAIISRDVDSASVKQFKNGSTLFALGLSASSQSSLINRPLSLIIIDETDRCDMNIATGLRSRQSHSRHKPWIYISTPTAPGVGINAISEDRQLHQQIIRCHACRHEYFPDFFEQVILPGFDEPLEMLTKSKLISMSLDSDLAYHHCPKCHMASTGKLGPEHRAWVVEKPHIKKIHVRLTPFDAPTIIKPSDLIVSMLTYSNPAEFRNQALGLPAKLSDSAITPDDIEFTKEEAPGGVAVGGLDLGKSSHYLKGIITEDVLFVEMAEIIPLAELFKRVSTNIVLHKLIAIVSDSLPYQETVLQWANKFPQMWPAIYTSPTTPQPELFKLKTNEEHNTRQVNIQNSLMIDHVMAMIVSKQIVFKSGPYDQLIINHLTDMRRIRDYRFIEERYKWIKSDKGNDHFLHTLVYLVVASKLFGSVNFSAGLPMGAFISKFALKQNF